MSFVEELEVKKPDMRKTAASLPNSDVSFELKMDVVEEAIRISKKDPDSVEASTLDGLLDSAARVSRPVEPKSGDEMSDVQEYFKTEAGIKRESSQMSGDTKVNVDGGGTSSLKCQLKKGLPSSSVKSDGGDELLAFQVGKQHMKEDLEMPCLSGFVSRVGVRSAPKTTRVSEVQGEDEEVDPNDMTPKISCPDALEEQRFSATTTVAEDDSTSTRGSLSGASLQDDLKAPKGEGLQEVKADLQHEISEQRLLKREEEVINHADVKCRQLDGAVDQGSEEDSHQQGDEDSDVDDPNDMPQRPVRASEDDDLLPSGSPLAFTGGEYEIPPDSVYHPSQPAAEENTNVQDEQPEVIVIKDDPHEVESAALKSLEKGKKPGRMIVEVVVDTYANFLKRQQKDFEKIKKFKNPKMHGEKAEKLEISLQSVWDRLKPIGLDPYPVNLDQDIKDTLVSRAFMSNVYGGNPISAFPSISKKHLEKHGLNDFMYLNTEYQQMAPQFPGNPGLFMNPDYFEVESLGPRRTFVRYNSGKWGHVGFYILLPTTPLSRQEWLDLDEQVKKAWCRVICLKGWGTGMRARIVARRVYCRKPTEEEWSPFAEARFKEAQPEDVREALDKGHEHLAVFTLKCVGYDEDFQRQVCEKWASWVPPPPQPKKKRGPKVEKGAKTTKADGGSQPQTKVEADGNNRRKRARSEESELSHAEVESDEDVSGVQSKLTSPKKKRKVALSVGVEEDSAGQEIVYRSKGTKSRPIVV